MPKTFAEYIAGRTKKPPQRLFKYRSVDQALTILKDGALWWSPPKEFEDTADCQWNPYEPLLTDEAWQAEEAETRRRLEGGDMDIEAIIPKYRRAWEGVLRSIQELPPDKRAAKIDELVSHNRNHHEETKTRYAERHNSLVQRLRVLCLSDEANSDDMWDEYADKRKGCLLAFDTWTLERTWELPVEQVVYGIAPPLLVSMENTRRRMMGEAVDLNGDMEELGRRWPLHKGMSFIHEREWRFVAVEPDTSNPTINKAVRFAPEALVEVVYRTACSATDRKALKKAVHDLRTRPRAKVIPSTGKVQ